ncbi:MAG: MFS transporter [Verrucomicrobia bacterium]|nr:MFS transporter [Verrucomicrobiota bacterium]
MKQSADIDRITERATESLTRRGRYLVLAAAFLGWMFAGVEMSIMVPATRPAIQHFLSQPAASLAGATGAVHFETSADKWLSWFVTAFLLGGALGGVVFGWLGDRAGRVKAMGWSILCYSGVTGLSYFVTTPEQLLVLRFIACLGIGGMWPSGVALVAEAWPSVSRPVLAGLIGSAANVGFLILGIMMFYFPITKETWRWVLLFGGTPLFLGLLVLWIVPESPRWLEARDRASALMTSPVIEVFRPPLLRLTLLGIALGTIPLLGGWASGQRLVPWAGQVADQLGLANLKAVTQTFHSSGAVIGSLLGGWIASRLGRRRSYFLISLGSLALSAYIFLRVKPNDPQFVWTVFALGLVSTSFFGWLPYFLPDLFPTSVRATGTGVSFNFGRILSAVALLSSTALSELFRGDISKMGATTSLVYGFGLVVAWFIPSAQELKTHRGSQRS